jgi:hypothetical protein
MRSNARAASRWYFSAISIIAARQDHVHMGMSAGRVVPAIFSQSTAEAEARFA